MSVSNGWSGGQRHPLGSSPTQEWRRSGVHSGMTRWAGPVHTPAGADLGCSKGMPGWRAWKFVREIPGIMDKQGWEKAAWYQRRWMGGAANQLVGPASDGQGDQGPLRIEPIKMDWVLQYERAQDLYKQISSPSVFANQAAKGQLRMKLNQQFRAADGDTIAFGDFAKQGRDLEKQYINFRGLSASAAYEAGLDALTAALGRFTLYVIVKGQATKKNHGINVSIDQIGVYLRDSYDFNGDQHLGYWRKPDMVRVDAPPSEMGRFSPYRCHNDWFRMTNAAYRRYRSKMELGEDFLIYSDVKVQRLSSPVSFTL